MNREIKFRVLNTKTKAWEEFNIPFEFYASNEIDANDYDWETLGEFTGLYDKNEKEQEVYQGDLIQAKDHELKYIYEVVWDEERLEWGVKNSLGMITSLWTFDKDFKVIGNIYENKELLK